MVPASEQGTSSTRSRALQRRAPIRQVPPAEEPAEGATKKHQCDRSHRSKERDECASRASATGGWSGSKRLRPQSEEQLGDTSAVFEGVLQSSPPRRQRSRVMKKSASAEKTPIGKGALRQRLLPGNPREPGLRPPSVYKDHAA